MLSKHNLNDVYDRVEIHFYNANGLLELVMKQPDPVFLLETLLQYTDKHNAVHIERRGFIIEVCQPLEDNHEQ